MKGWYRKTELTSKFGSPNPIFTRLQIQRGTVLPFVFVSCICPNLPPDNVDNALSRVHRKVRVSHDDLGRVWVYGTDTTERDFSRTVKIPVTRRVEGREEEEGVYCQVRDSNASNIRG